MTISHRLCTALYFALFMGVLSPAVAGQIDTARLSEIVKVLASDEFEGRAPGGPGEVKTVDYLMAQFEGLGLAPGGVDSSWTQPVPLIHTQ